MISMKVTDVEMFYDQVHEELDVAENRALRKFGFLAREQAQEKLRSSKSRSRPGQPPHDHTGLLRRFILFNVDKQNKSVVIGPKLLNRKSKNVAESLEKGGVSQNVKGRSVRIVARPFMVPTLRELVSQRMPSVFTDIIKTVRSE